MANKRIVLQALAGIIICLGAIGVFVFFVDPYQQYRPSEDYLGNQRLEIGGVARNHDYDAFITGSSMAMNHYPEVADSLWGWKTKNFSIMGATDDDYSVILPFILSRGKAKNVIIGVDFFSFARRRGAVNKFLYDDNRFNDYEYLWNYTSLSSCFKVLRSPSKEKNLYHFNSPVGRHTVVDDYNSKVESGGWEGEVFDLEVMKTRFDESLYPIISESSDSVKWFVYFPPYSIAEFIVYDRFGDLDAILALKEYIVKRLQGLENVELYDFQNDSWITDLDEYMDLRHHSHDYNNAILKAIHDGDFKISDSTAVSGDHIRNLVKTYRDSIR